MRSNARPLTPDSSRFVIQNATIRSFNLRPIKLFCTRKILATKFDKINLIYDSILQFDFQKIVSSCEVNRQRGSRSKFGKKELILILDLVYLSWKREIRDGR